MHLFQKRRVKLYCDNKAGVYIKNNSVYQERSKHIEVDCHFIIEKIKNKEIVTTFVGLQDELADIFTKWLAKSHTHQICFKLGLFDIYKHKVEGEF